MSNASAASMWTQDVDKLQDQYSSNYGSLAAAALIFYEYIVTFPQEVHVIWGARLTTVTVIFAINRYMLMVQGISSALYAVLWHTPLSCNAVNLFNAVTGVVLQAVTASFAAFRTYAISGHQVVPALLVLLLGLIQVGGYYIFVYAQLSVPFVAYIGSYPVCEWKRNGRISNAALNMSLAAAICSAVADLIVVLVTWYKTFRLAVEMRKLRIKGSIATMLMRDGTLHFMALLLLNIFNIQYVFTGSQYSGYASNFLLPISSILISRFILNLRQVSYGSVDLDTISHSTLDTLDLPSRLVGNFGAELQDTSLGFDIEDNMEDEQGITEGCEVHELAEM
ncbi:uncharacterized protein LAESUDRAFT_730378 [Laetiporus sulphureus 93-53]|uniref:DUF6533 domain-containing protein n=1 Tax=Laetiporus sulphureus 93-53 TaxID=1314785 RepID=A0A165C4V5_9APHY|nr:uncharacterized protein LAESUDRAFT_730378 [Laetiporus sulphureus 93-53]KZT02208.1 hypothetical protein LAESUDRAFT_730378 [Laetiporus sulphureus 93-53]